MKKTKRRSKNLDNNGSNTNINTSNSSTSLSSSTGSNQLKREDKKDSGSNYNKLTKTNFPLAASSPPRNNAFIERRPSSSHAINVSSNFVLDIGKWVRLAADATEDDQNMYRAYGHCAVLLEDGHEDSIVIIGGCTEMGCFTKELSCFNLVTETWTHFTRDDIPSRHFHSAIVFNGSIYIYGGKSNGYHANLMKLTKRGSNWKVENLIQAECPLARYGHSAVVFEEAMYIFGGYDQHGFTCDDLYQYQFDTNTWVVENHAKTISENIERFHHTAAVMGRSMFIFGGNTHSTLLADNNLLEYHFDTCKWTTVTTKGHVPSPRWGHSACVCSDPRTGKEAMYIFGGCSGNICFSTLHKYDYEYRTWYLIDITNNISANISQRYCSSLIVYHDSLYVCWGKNRINTCYGDVYKFELDDTSNKRRSMKGLASHRERSNNVANSATLSISPNATNNTPSVSSSSSSLISLYHDHAETITLKCHYGEEIRVIPVDKYCGYEYIKSYLKQQYNKDVIVQYRDEDGDFITVRSDSDLKMMFQFADRSNISQLKVYLSDVVQFHPQPEIDESQQKRNFGSRRLWMQQQQMKPIHWQLGALLGEGGFGKVYLGMNTDTGELFAVKQVSLEGKESHLDKVAALEKEISVMQTLSHHNIVRYIGTERNGMNLNIFLEYVSGGSLYSLLRRFKRFNENLIRSFTRQILHGLDYLHENNIIHRDIKAANILVDNIGVIKLADFGASKKLADIVSMDDENGCNSVTGSPYWMAPEVINNPKGYGRKADIWSVGASIIEMATGQPPFSDLPPITAIFRIGAESVIPPIPSFLSPAAQDFLRCCFQRDPHKRSSARELLDHPFLKVSSNELYLSNQIIPVDSAETVVDEYDNYSMQPPLRPPPPPPSESPNKSPTASPREKPDLLPLPGYDYNEHSLMEGELTEGNIISYLRQNSQNTWKFLSDLRISPIDGNYGDDEEIRKAE